MVSQNIQMPRVITHHTTTTNQSFMDIHYYLKDKGIINNKFFLAIYDTGLMGIDPRDPKLPSHMKQRILRECCLNYWYFLREVVRIPDQGGSVDNGVRYRLHRGNLAMNFLFILNYNIFLELPRQHGKTMSAMCRYLWVFNFGTSNSEMMFINKKHDDSKQNLQMLKTLRRLLPTYLRMDHAIDRDGKRITAPNRVETIQHLTNFNKIKTLPGARNKAFANGLGRGCTMPIQYYDEFAFIIYNRVIYNAAIFAFSTASKNAKRNGAPHGILITTTPGDLTTDEGQYADFVRNNATPWNEAYYDYSFQKLEALKAANTNSTFFYVRYTYQQLGSGEDYFKEQVRETGRDWDIIRREVLLEWSKVATNCPFRKEDLEIIKGYCKEPIRTMLFGSAGQFQFQVFEDYDPRFPPIIGVDVAGGQQKDSSAITIIDSKTTRVCATFNCNYITSFELADLIYTLVTGFMKNAIVNIERNGGFGQAVLQKLAKSPIKKNLYWEIKDRVLEERSFNGSTTRRTEKRKIYGTDNTKMVRERLIEILHERVQYHKDKFVAPMLHAELETMEVKKNGKTEHSSNAHDDQIFSYLMALYVWYEGIDLRENFNITKSGIMTDQDLEEAYIPLQDRYESIDIDLDETDELIEEQIKQLQPQDHHIYMMKEFDDKEYEEEQAALNLILQSPAGRAAYAKSKNVEVSELDLSGADGVPDSVFDDFYNDNENVKDGYAGNLGYYFKNNTTLR